MSDSVEMSEKLRTVAGQILSGDALDSFVRYAPVDAYTLDDGGIDEDKVIGHLTALYAARLPQQQPQRAPQWGQYSGQGQPPEQPGSGARAALAKRHGVKQDTNTPGSGAQSGPGAAGRAAAARRHGRMHK
jgi:hypothetical protein